jgi:hypothetical protein
MGGSLEGNIEGDDRLYDGGDRSRLESSIPSLSSSASHLRFLVRFAGGEEGGGVAAGTGALAVVTWAGGGQAVVVADGHRCRRQRRLRLFVAAVSVGKRQNSVTSWNPVWWLTETRAAWPEETHMS